MPYIIEAEPRVNSEQNFLGAITIAGKYKNDKIIIKNPIPVVNRKNNTSCELILCSASLTGLSGSSNS